MKGNISGNCRYSRQPMEKPIVATVARRWMASCSKPYSLDNRRNCIQLVRLLEVGYQRYYKRLPIQNHGPDSGRKLHSETQQHVSRHWLCRPDLLEHFQRVRGTNEFFYRLTQRYSH